MTVTRWLVALVRTALWTSWLWGSMLLDRFGLHAEALALVLAAAAVLAVLVIRDFLRFRRAYLRWRRGRRP